MSAYLAVPAISYCLTDAAAAAGVSLRTIRAAIDTGDLVAHYVGPKNGKPVVRAIDLDLWVEAQPTESSRGT